MKILIISDIHGIKTNLDFIRKKYRELKCEKLIVLGDLYYNSNPTSEYDINYVKDFLEEYKDNIICIKGNCDSKVDEMINSFPLIHELSVIPINNKNIYLTHGHIFNDTNWKYKNTILIFGHYHYPFIKEKNNILFINPGSISLPKNEIATFLFINDDEFIIYDINNNIIDRKIINNSTIF